MGSAFATRAIPEEIWQRYFASENGSYGGKKFEKLSIDILEEYFGRGWAPTKASHDGNKDFVLQCAGERHWAESKAYRDPISYHVVSPTLFMAILGDAAKVIFLSRSPFKRTAKPLFAQYQRKTGRQVHCFDGVILDNLIARSPALTQKYFPGHQFSPVIRTVRITTSVSMDVTRPAPEAAESDELAEEGNDKLIIGLGEFIRIDVTLANETSAAAEVKVTLVEPTDGQSTHVFEVESFAEQAGGRQYALAVAAGEVTQFAIMLRGCKPVEKAELPALVIKVVGQDVETRRLGAATVSRLYRIGLTGKQHLAIRDAVLAAARHGRRHRVFQVVGRSGTGKSRLLQEISDALATTGYDVYRYDKEFEKPENSEQILRVLLADLNHLPQVPAGILPESGAILADEGDADSDEQVLTRLIYDRSTRTGADAALTARALLRSTRARKTAVIIDNVQNVDGMFADTLDELVGLLSRDKNAPPALLVLAVNLDLEVEGSKAAQLRRNIARMARNDDTSHPVRSHEVKELAADDVTQFIEDALHSPGGRVRLADYPLTRRAFHEHIPHTPLQLWETLRYLRDAGILRLDGDILVADDPRDSQLAALLRDIPQELADIMRLRWEEVQTAAGRSTGSDVTGEMLAAAMRTVSAIGATSRAQLVELGVQAAVLDNLVRVGLLREAGFGEIAFFHQRVFHFFQSEFQGKFPPGQAWDLADRLRKSGADVALFQQFFVLQDLAQAVSADDIRSTADQLCRRGATPEFYRPYLAALLQHLIRSRDTLEAWELETFERIGDCYQQLESLRAGADALNRAYCDRVVAVHPDALPGPAFADFAYRVVNAQLSVAEDERALEVIEQAIAELPQTVFAAAEQRELSQAKLTYRKLAVIKNFGRADEALVLGGHAQAAAHRLGDRWLEIEALMDSAEIFLSRGPGQHRQEALQRYAEAIRLFHEDFSLRDPVPVRSFVARTIIALCEGRWHDASEVSADGILYASRIRNYFWLARLRLLHSRARLCHSATTGLVDLSAIIDEIKITQDEMNVYAAGRDIWANYYLLGKARMLAREISGATVAFSEAIKALTSGSIKPERLVRRHEPLYDIAVSLRLLRQFGMDCMFDKLGSTLIGQECLSVLRAEDALFDKQLEAWRDKVFIALNTPHGVLTLTTP